MGALTTRSQGDNMRIEVETKEGRQRLSFYSTIKGICLGMPPYALTIVLEPGHTVSLTEAEARQVAKTLAEAESI